MADLRMVTHKMQKIRHQLFYSLFCLLTLLEKVLKCVDQTVCELFIKVCSMVSCNCLFVEEGDDGQFENGDMED
uniref:Uncharacterized protein n=1 Tax=Arion vulgaris TaxID=1028688 RepID=A0A0B6ZS17_9EUPU